MIWIISFEYSWILFSGHYSPFSTPSLKRKKIQSKENLHLTEKKRERGILHPSHILSNETLSSGYNTDQFRPVDTDTMDTEDYELWERRRPVTVTQSYKNSPGVPRSRKVIRSRAQVLQVMIVISHVWKILNPKSFPYL
jgi:hypothetical protein